MPRVFAHEDFLDLEKVSAPAAGGLAEVVFEDVQAGFLWLVRHVVVQCTSLTQTKALLYVGDALSQHIRDGSITGNLDVADYPKELIVPGSRQLRIQWKTPDAGSLAIASVQAELVSERSVPAADTRLLTRAASSVGV